jgi:hypothetical protein
LVLLIHNLAEKLAQNQRIDPRARNGRPNPDNHNQGKSENDPLT